MIDKFLEYVKAEKLLHRGDSVVVGVSGGADSVCLFLLLVKIKEQMNLRLIAVHVNHCIRREAADNDEAFVKKLCADNGVEFFAERTDVPKLARDMGLSLEETGRYARRRAYDKYGRQEFGDNYKIALAHHADDNVETVIYRMTRGTGIRGLRGILPKSGRIIHPLLTFQRQEIEAELISRGVSWCTDETNFNPEYDRNRIRQVILPELLKLNERAREHIVDTAKDAINIFDYINENANKELSRIISGDNSVRADELAGLNEVLREPVIALWYNRLGFSVRNLSRSHIEQITHLAEGGKNAQISLPQNLILKYEYGRLYLEEKAAACSDKRLVIDKDKLEGDGFASVHFNGYDIELRLDENTADCVMGENPFYICANYDKITNICVRTRETGDKVVINSHGGTKSVKHLMIDAKLPRHKRDMLPLVTDGENIIWVCGLRMSMDYYIDNDTQLVLRVAVRKVSYNE